MLPSWASAFKSIARSSGWFMTAQHAVRELHLTSWCIGAGAVRALVWDTLHDFPTPNAFADIDVAYFAGTAAPNQEGDLQADLASMLPGVPREVTNQASLHVWSERCFGHPVEPLRSLEEAVGSWPEYATSVGIWLDEHDSFHFIAPHGLDDLFALMVMHNPVRASTAKFRERVEQKQYSQCWPKVTVVCG